MLSPLPYSTGTQTNPDSMREGVSEGRGWSKRLTITKLAQKIQNMLTAGKAFPPGYKRTFWDLISKWLEAQRAHIKGVREHKASLTPPTSWWWLHPPITCPPPTHPSSIHPPPIHHPSSPAHPAPPYQWYLSQKLLQWILGTSSEKINMSPSSWNSKSSWGGRY